MRVHELGNIVNDAANSNPAIMLSEFLCADFPFVDIGNNSALLRVHRFGFKNTHLPELQGKNTIPRRETMFSGACCHVLCSVGCWLPRCLLGVRGVHLSLALVIFSHFHQTELPTSNNSLARSPSSSERLS